MTIFSSSYLNNFFRSFFCENRRYTLVIGLFLLLFPGSLFAQEPEVLQELKETISNASEYDAVKLAKIESLREKLENAEAEDLRKRYRLNEQLFQEYKVFKQDSAFVYGLKTKELASQLDSLPLIASAVVNLADVSVSAGMYKEALDFLHNIEPEKIPANIRSLYYGLLGRCYSEMAEYSNLPYFSSEYNELASNYRQSALDLTEEGTFFHSFLKAFIEYREGRVEKAIADFNKLLQQQLGLREEALVHYILGDLYDEIGQKDEALEHFAKASIADVKTSTKETLAIIRLSELLFEKGETKFASAFIQKANQDAAFYGAQHRKIQVGAILPLIEEKVVQKIEKQRQRLYWQAIILSLLLLFVLGLAVVIYLQVRRLKRARRIILQAHHNLQDFNEQLTAVNEEIKNKNLQLNQVNNQLLEANTIKEEYIGFFFTHDADIFEKFREFKNKIQKDIDSGDLEKARYRLGNYDLKKEKEKLLRNFDEAFIRLFPNFIEEFNSLLKEEEQIKLKKNQILNKELRIFALIRLGIRHNEIIAQILGYSVNSIYAYKSKIRKMSRLDKKDFDQKLIENTTLKL
ncbi:MAG: DUF6377 domain-containing protein [Salegentibacter sp.]